jgi:hypothetical protein
MTTIQAADDTLTPPRRSTLPFSGPSPIPIRPSSSGSTRGEPRWALLNGHERA